MGVRVTVRVDDGSSSEGRIVHDQKISEVFVPAFCVCETITVPAGICEIKERGLDLVRGELTLWVSEDGFSETSN